MKPHLRKLGRWWYCGVRRPRRPWYLAWQGATANAAWLRWLSR